MFSIFSWSFAHHRAEHPVSMIRLRSLYWSCIHAYTRNLSSAFNPSRLAPVDSHMHMHTLIETGGQWATIHSARGAWGYSALLKGTSAVTRRWTATPPAVSPPILWEVRVGIDPPTFRLWDDPLSPLNHGRPLRNPSVLFKLLRKYNHFKQLNGACSIGINMFVQHMVLFSWFTIFHFCWLAPFSAGENLSKFDLYPFTHKTRFYQGNHRS